MKFKKIEIQGFRVYGDKEEATFDFTKENGVADLISIYAPNGFGKTSFYDAIEWTFTNKIKRIENAIDNFDLIKTEKVANREGNRQSDAIHVISKRGYQNPNKFINIETTIGDFSRKIKKTSRKGTADYDNKAKLENPNFRDVILSQEGINSFLAVDKPEDRYKNFIKNFDNENLDRLHQNIIALRKENEKRLKILEDSLSVVSKQIVKKIDQEIIDSINKQIEELQNFDIKLNLVTKDFKLSNIPIFKSEIVEVNNNIQLGESSTIEKLKKQRAELKKLEKDLMKYEGHLTQKKDIQGLINDASKIIEGFSKLNKQNNLLKNLKENEKKEDKIIEDLTFLDINWQNYLEKSYTNNNILVRKQEIDNYLVKLNNLEELINLNIVVFEDRRNFLKEGIKVIESNSKNFKLNSDLYKSTLKKIPKVTSELSLKKKELEKGSLNQEKMKKEIENLNLVRKNIKSGVFEFSTSSKAYESNIAELKIERSQILEKEKDIQELNIKLKDSKSFHDNLNYLLELGRKIVDNTKQSNCPLCKREHNDYEKLLYNISLENPTSNSIEDNVSKINQIESELKEHKKSLQKNSEKLLVSLKNKFEETQLEINKASIFTNNLKKQVNSLAEELDKLQSFIYDYNENFNEIDVEEELVKSENDIKEYKIKIIVYDSIIGKYNFWISKIKEKIIQSKIDVLNEEQKQASLSNDSIYKKFTELITIHRPSPDKKHIGHLLRGKKTAKKNLEKEISTLEFEIKSLKDFLKEFEIKQIKKQNEKYYVDLSKVNSFISEFEKMMKSLDINSKKVEKQLSLKIISNNKEIEKNEEALRLLAKLEKMIEPFGEFLNYQELKFQEKKLKAQIQIHNNFEKDLKIDLGKISDKIQEMIENFFFDDLINKIYAKIDPHPKYKEINFEVDFSDYGSPKLNVFTLDENQNGKRVPNLYFSTAQMNVLSLSVFLAKALHAIDEKGNPIDAIFIDDPVQSMDSINVLSVIDLLRNLIVNHNKQIVISTHDENFFNLIQKKIPSEHFRSKFLELETFGKLKNNNDSETPLTEEEMDKLIRDAKSWLSNDDDDNIAADFSPPEL